MSHKFLGGVLSCLLGAASLAPQAASAQASLTGQWSKLQNVPQAPIHNVLLPNGKVLMWGRDHVERLWDPITQAVTIAPHAGYDLFCAGHTHLSDGRVLIAGGHVVDFVGLAKASIYDPATNSWAATPDMNAGRWYPTVTALGNGDALVVSGEIDTSVGVNPLPQVYQAATNSWRSLTGAQLNQALYPMMFLAPNGRVIDVGPSNVTRWLDTTGAGSWSTVGSRRFGWRDFGSAVMYADGKILLAGGADPPTTTAEVIDLNVATPSWRSVASMRFARRHLNTTLLPDGTLLATGGTSGPGFENKSTPVFAAELWNPATERWTTLASASVPRLYHSSALLLPDGRVMTNGGDGFTDIEVFSPPYLFKGARPTMSSVPAAAGYNQRFSVSSPEAADIGKVTLIRLSSPTHAFDQGQRMNVLQFSRGTGTLEITTPGHANLAPPGYYMLFIVNSAGVPSLASMIQLSATAPAPPPPQPAITPALGSLSPSSAQAGGPAFTLTVNGSNFVADSVVHWNGTARATTFASDTRLSAAIAAADIAAAGTAQVSVLNPGGAASGTLPFSISAASGPSFTLSVTRSGSAATRATIRSSPAGINCGSICSASFGSASTVTLTAVTNGNGVFAGWSGACSGTGACVVTMNANQAVTATTNRR